MIFYATLALSSGLWWGESFVTELRGISKTQDRKVYRSHLDFLEWSSAREISPFVFPAGPYSPHKTRTMLPSTPRWPPSFRSSRTMLLPSVMGMVAQHLQTFDGANINDGMAAQVPHLAHIAAPTGAMDMDYAQATHHAAAVAIEPSADKTNNGSSYCGEACAALWDTESEPSQKVNVTTFDMSEATRNLELHDVKRSRHRGPLDIGEISCPAMRASYNPLGRRQYGRALHSLSRRDVLEGCHFPVAMSLSRHWQPSKCMGPRQSSRRTKWVII
jgi:hypothetical protein